MKEARYRSNCIAEVAVSCQLIEYRCWPTTISGTRPKEKRGDWRAQEENMPHSCLIIARSNLVGHLHPSHLVIKASIALDSIIQPLVSNRSLQWKKLAIAPIALQKLQFHVSSSNIDAGQQRFQVRAPKKKGAIGELRKRTNIPESSGPAFFQALALSPVFLNLGNGFRPWFQNQTLPIR